MKSCCYLLTLVLLPPLLFCQAGCQTERADAEAASDVAHAAEDRGANEQEAVSVEARSRAEQSSPSTDHSDRSTSVDRRAATKVFPPNVAGQAKPQATRRSPRVQPTETTSPESRSLTAIAAAVEKLLQ